MATHRTSASWPRLAWQVLIVALILPTAVTWLYFVALHGTHAALQQSAYALLKGCQFALPVFAIWMWARADLWRVKFRGVGVGRGIVFGLLVVLLMVGVYEWLIRDRAVGARLQQMIFEKLHSMGLASPIKLILVGVFYAVIHSGLEEYYWRWFVFRWARLLMPAGLAVGLSSLGFMLHHVLLLGFFLGFGQWQTWLFSAAIAVGGACWAWLYHRTNNILAVWTSHALVDTGIFALGYAMVRNQLIT